MENTDRTNTTTCNLKFHDFIDELEEKVSRRNAHHFICKKQSKYFN